ncbi:MAG: GAF domain-containing protein [Myxococcota bacterium]|nr:GAF domain-containing protein [Myxococcota bacterium]
MTAGSAHILVADDEQGVLDALAEIAAALGLGFQSARSMARVLEIARASSPAVIVLGRALEGENVRRGLAQLGQNDPDTRIILLSDGQEHERLLDALEDGASDYLARPLHAREARLAVQRAIASWHRRKEEARFRELVAGVLENREADPGPASVMRMDDPLAALAQSTVDAAAAALGLGKVSLMMLDAPGNWLRVVASAGHRVAPNQMDVMLPGEGVAGFALGQGLPQLVIDAKSDPRYRSLVVPERYADRSFAVVPLLSEGRGVGVLCGSQRQDGRPLDDDALLLLRLLGQKFMTGWGWAGGVSGRRQPRAAGLGEFDDTVASAEYSTGGSDRLELLSEQAVFLESDGDAELAREICQAANLELGPEATLASALATLAKGISADLVSLYLADPNAGVLNLEASAGGGGARDRRNLPLSPGLTARVLEKGAVVLCMKPLREPEFDFDIDTPEDGIPLPLLFMPISIRGRVIGLVRAFLQQGAPVSSRTGEVAAAVLSAAVRNGLLYRSLVSSIEEIAEARRLGRS